MNRARRSSVLSMILIAVLVFTAVFNVAITGTMRVAGNAPTADNVATATSGIQKSDVNLDSVREQYLKHQTVEANTASFDGRRWVVVELEGESLFDAFQSTSRFSDFTEFTKSVEGKKVLASIKAKQSRFLDKLDKYGVDYTYKYSYSALSTGVAIQVDASGYNTVAAMSGVEGVYYSESYAVPKFEAVENNANVYTTGIYDSDIDIDGDGEPDDDYQGQGMAVAILDTGLDRTHEAFNPDKYRQNLDAAGGEVRYTKDYIAELLERSDLKAEQFGAGLNDLYYNEKVPFAYDYADDDPEVFPGYSNHGTHVAGIVAGKDDTYTVNEETGETFRGVAPLAQLVICKVFTDNLYSDILGGANDIDILAALEDCAKLGVDVINMSLGTSAGFADEKAENRHIEIYNKIRELGISLVCAASNDYSSGFGGGNGTNLSTNPDSGTVGSPSTYFSALSVASINGQKSKYIQGNNDENQIAFITNASDGDGNRLEFIEELREQLAAKYGPDSAYARNGGDNVFTKGTSGDIVLKYVLVGGVGRPNNYTASIRTQLSSRTYNGQPVDGTVALIKRGDTTFAEKVQEAMSNGADAVIIYNNVSGTINMSLGEVADPVATCLITMDASAPFVDYAKGHSNIGTIQVSDTYEAGPFMSDFSSWGPVSDLTLKPEITAHGGEITSSVPGAYDVLSGTSMASPNMAGAVAVLRQYVKETTTGLDGNALNARVNQLLMSTATIARNEEGNPYSPRKQGAGLAGIADAVLSEGFITVAPYGKAADVYTTTNESTKNCIVDGWLDKTKIELFDDPARTGVYELKFTVHNITDVQQIYVPTTHVMTETLASDNRTVAEKAYMLTDMCTIVYSGEGYADGKITVPGKSSVNITVTVTLGDEARAYFAQKVTRQIVGTDGRPQTVTTEPFKNGMYVEGFVSLDNVTNGESADAKGVTLGVPYLAFYGDWTASPLFDYDVYEISESESNSAIDFENKLKSTSLPSQVIGRYHNDDYIIPLGTYLYEMDEEEDDIYPERDKIALSQYDEEGSYTVYELYAAYAGLLRNASKVETVVTNAKTGEKIYEETLLNVGKAYAAGGGNRGAFVRYEINPSEWGWQNNDEFYFKVEGWLDYKNADGEYAQSTAKDDEPQTEWEGTRNTFEFPLTIDYEAPQIVDYTIRFDSYKEYGVTKYRTYLDLSVYDNQYVMAVLPCYLKKETEGKVGTYLNLLTEYPIPVYGSKGETTKVSIDITDYYEQYVLNEDLDADRALFVQVEDYAMNSEVYQISLGDDSLTYPTEQVTFISDSKLKDTGRTGRNAGDDDHPETTYHIYELTNINPFELYQLNIPSAREKEYLTQNLQWRGANDLIKVEGNEIYALGNGLPATLQLVGTERRYNESRGWYDFEAIYAQINVTVGDGAQGRMPSASRLNFKPIHAGDNHMVNLDSALSGSVEVNPGDVRTLEPYVTPWYFEDAYEFRNKKEFKYTWDSTKPDVAEVDAETGTVTFKKRGTVTITCMAEDASYKLLVKSVDFTVGEDYYVNNYYLLEWYGGEKVEIPTDVNVMYLDEDCFKNDETITEVILPPLLMEIPEYAFQNCKNLRKITIPSQCAYIGPHAFEGCENLETVVFPEYVDANKDPVPGYYGSITVGHFAFAGCGKLKNFVNDKGEDQYSRLTLMYDGAFMGCTGLEKMDLSWLRVVGSYVFAGCTGLKDVTLSADTAIGPYMFSGCTGLGTDAAHKKIEFSGKTLPEGAFEGCSGLTEFEFKSSVLGIGAYALADTSITSIQLPAGEYAIGSGAFANCARLAEVSVDAGSTITFDGLNPFEGCPLITAFKVNGEGESYVVKEDGALYNFEGDTLISLPSSVTQYIFPAGVTKIGDSALSGSSLTSIDLSGITSIGKYAFAGSKLERVNWPASIETIAEGTFYDCDSLKYVQGVQNIKEVGAYAFASCNALESLELAALTKVGDYGFCALVNRDDDSHLSWVHAPNLEEVGAYAFAGTAITAADYPKVTKVGEGAFRECAQLHSVHLGAVTEMGDFAFYKQIYKRPAATIETVIFEEGATVIGNYAFSTYDPRVDAITRANAVTSDELVIAYVRPTYMNITRSTTLTSVTLPSTVETIGAFAFAGQAGITSLEMSGVKEIGDSAFRMCGALRNLNLRNVETIGDYAFYGAALETVELDKAKEIGAYAFAGGAETLLQLEGAITFNYSRTRVISGGKITTLTMKAAERIGAFAFAGNRIENVELPATMNKRTYTFTEVLYDDKGREERTRERIANTFGAGAFAYNPLLSITLAKDAQGNDNPAFLSIDGVLYAYLTEDKDSLELVQYPGGRACSQTRGVYTVADKTASIAASAFEGAGRSEDGVRIITRVEFPYTVKTIGSSAFFGTDILEYKFNSVQAPTLIAANDPYALEVSSGVFAFLYWMQERHYPWDVKDRETGEIYLDLDNIKISAFYSNFVDYLFMSGYGNAYFSFADEAMPNITFYVPGNGVGYDSEVYLAYAQTMEQTQNAMDDDAYDAVAKLQELTSAFPDESAIAAMSKEELEAGGALDLAVKAAREAYDKVSGSDQQALLEAQYEKLLAYEKALRDARKQKGIEVTLKSVTVGSPTKIRYRAGERFDPAGMVITVEYSDGSKLRIAAEDFEKYNVSIPDDLIEPNKKITIIYTDEFTGEVRETQITVNVTGSVTPSDPGGDDPQNPGGQTTNVGGLPTWAIAVIAVAAVLVVAAAVTATLILLKKKGKNAPKKEKKPAEQKQEQAEQESEQEQAQEPSDEEYPQEKEEESSDDDEPQEEEGAEAEDASSDEE